MKCKACFKCEVRKPLSEFYKHCAMGDGHLNKCKECTKKDAREHYIRNIDYYKEYDRKRAMLPHRVNARNDYQKTEAGKKAIKRAKEKWDRNNPNKRKASNMVTNAVRDGRLHKPKFCERCGSDKRIHGHHCDYSKPLEVMWLCAKCHNKWHRENGEALNG